MRILSHLFGKQNTAAAASQTSVPEAAELKKLRTFMDTLLSCTHYVAKSEYMNALPEYRKTVEYFNVLKNSGMLAGFCKQNGLKKTEIEDTCNRYNCFETLIDEQNERYIRLRMAKEKDYLDNILKACDPNIVSAQC